MCLVVLAVGVRSDYPLIIAANRDEFKSRPSLKAATWAENPAILGGRDLEKGGTWMAVHNNGRWGLVTNIRNPRLNRTEALSRGELVGNYLLSQLGPQEFIGSLTNVEAYNPFNLLVGRGTEVWHLNSLEGKPSPIGPGIHGLSNDTLNTPWPKVEATKNSLAKLVSEPDFSLQRLFQPLTDRTIYPDQLLPNTGVPPEWERLLSSAFIDAPAYGTRCSTVAALSNDSNWDFEERVWG